MPRRYAIDPRDPAYNDSDDDALPFNPPDDDETEPEPDDDPAADFIYDPIRDRSYGHE